MSHATIATTRVLPRLFAISCAVAFASQLGLASPTYAQASPDCFKVCSTIFNKHISALFKCASKEMKTPGTGETCSAKAAAGMITKYNTKSQSKCGGMACADAYVSGGGLSGCYYIMDTVHMVIWGTNANPEDTATEGALSLVRNLGCQY
jgi:hypothetical protein